MGGDRPSQTTHQILSPVRITDTDQELQRRKGGVSLAPFEGLPPTLNMRSRNPISSCSKASRGLFVQPWVKSIFTPLAISPGPLLRQLFCCYAIRAGRNSPDKEFRYLRTIIVIAGVHQRFSSKPSRLLRSTSPLNVLTLARHQPLYVTLRFCRDLCFW